MQIIGLLPVRTLIVLKISLINKAIIAKDGFQLYHSGDRHNDKPKKTSEM